LVTQLGREIGKPQSYLDPSAMEELIAYRWPGNVRELRNVVERALILAREEAIRGADVRALLPHGESADASGGFSAYLGEPYNQAKEQVLSDFTVAYLKSKLVVHNNHITQAAVHSGMPRQNFSRLMKRYLGRSE
jgi:two-component system response regulator AtoC